MEEKMEYGQCVYLFPVLNAKPIIFIPKYYGWEKKAAKAKIQVFENEINCNIGTKLLFLNDDGITAMKIPFKKRETGYVCDLIGFFRKKSIPFERGQGIYCDGEKKKKKDSSSEVIFNDYGMIEYSVSPYWGNQFELQLVNSDYWLEAGGKKIKTFRIKYCKQEKREVIENWFQELLKKKKKINLRVVDRMLREVQEKPCPAWNCLFYVEKEKGTFDWCYYPDLFKNS